ncbi:hypothetical protein SEUCBS140593_008688 [Sporothrix eucalyptigena]|uniref:Xylanolytic transcriptional activator regulatory domain-containing protein n=1 Tax=Sporothrix eucalyptigena TaxID=1812306 RepID=A0ABP0CR72_9PEZI
MGCQVCRARKVRCDGREGGTDINNALTESKADLPVVYGLPDSQNKVQRRAAGVSAVPCTVHNLRVWLDGWADVDARVENGADADDGSSNIDTRTVIAGFYISQQPPPPPSPPQYLMHDASPPPLPSPSVSFAMDTDNGSASTRHRLSSTATLGSIVEVPEPMSETPAGPGTTPGSAATDDTHALSWLYAPRLPTTPALLRRAVDHYFANVHPLRCFAFVHKPTFMRQLHTYEKDGLPASDSEDLALLQIVCAHGAKFCALDYSETVAQQPSKLVQAAGHAWAQAAEQTLMTNYGRISVTSLMTAVLLYDYRYRLGDFAHALVMSGVTTRMAHALQLNMEPPSQPNRANTGERGEGGDGVDSTERASVVLSPVERESRRRLMWACYVIDTWTGSGVDQLTLMRGADLHIQLPCNERDFLFQRSVVTGRLDDETSSENSGLMASYIRIVSIWKRVARYVKHLDTAALPWLPGSEFSVLDDDLRRWKEGLAPYLDFSADSIYTRLESSQLGALCLLHCTYYNAMLDLYRIAMPELFSLRHAFRFPPDQMSFLHTLQHASFQNACRMAAVLEKTAAHGSRHLADSMTPMFAYNSSRVLLYYLVRLHDPFRGDTPTTVDETLARVQSNNRVLQCASAMMPLSEPLLVTARRWLQKLQSGLHKQQEGAAVAALYGGGGGLGGSGGTPIIPPGSGDTEIPGMADDPASGSRERRQQPQQQPSTEDSPDSASTDTPDNVLHPLSLFRLARKTLNDKAYSEPSSRASYAGGGLPPLRDVGIHGGTGNRPPSPILERMDQGGGGFALSAPLPPAVVSPPAPYTNNLLQQNQQHQQHQPSAAPSAAPTPGGTLTAMTTLTNWENAFDDLALGLHVLQDYPHWDIHGFDHISSATNNSAPPGNGGSVFDSSIGGLATWPEFRKT